MVIAAHVLLTDLIVLEIVRGIEECFFLQIFAGLRAHRCLAPMSHDILMAYSSFQHFHQSSNFNQQLQNQFGGQQQPAQWQGYV